MPRPYHYIGTVADLRARCDIDLRMHCWLWRGAVHSRSGLPILHTFDHARGEKRTMSGPVAAWNIGHQAAPARGRIVFRACCQTLCLNPAHLREARSRAEIGEHIRRSGVRKGLHLEARRESLKLAHQALGRTLTPPDIVRAIRAAPAGTTGRALAALHRLSRSCVSRIRRGETHREVV